MTRNNGRRVLIVGCGQLGSRHLQAVASLPEVKEIEVVDPRPEGLEMGRQRLAETSQSRFPDSVRWLSSLEEASEDGDLCIVATQAEGRCALVRDIIDALGYSSFLMEKIVGQSVSEIDQLLDYSRDRGVCSWVNFQTRSYPFHKMVKQRLHPGDPVIFSAVGGNHGLATNGVHNADLFAFYAGADCIKSAGASVDPVLHPSKRGESLFELSGTLSGYSENGSHFTLSYAQDHATSEQISISTQRYRCIVDHVQRWAVESDADTEWAWQQVPFEGNIQVSHMTKAFASDILASGWCELPTLEEAMPAHRFVLTELQPHFSRLLGRDFDRCPVT